MSREKTLQESVALFDRLKKDFSNSKCDLVQCGNLLSQLKVGGAGGGSGGGGGGDGGGLEFHGASNVGRRSHHPLTVTVD